MGAEDVMDYEPGFEEYDPAYEILAICKFMREQMEVHDAYLRVAANEENLGFLAQALAGIESMANAARVRYEKIPCPIPDENPKALVERLLNQRPWSKPLIDRAQRYVGEVK